MCKAQIKQYRREVVTMKDLQKLYALVKAEAISAGIPVSSHIMRCSVNTRLRKAMGRCIKKTNMLGVCYEIEIAGCMVADGVDDMEIRDTIMHELIHTCPGCWDHGNVFHHFADIVNRKYGYHVDTYADREQLEAAGVVIKDPGYKYMLKCNVCGHEFKRKRWSDVLRYPELYHCACGGGLSTFDINGNPIKSRTSASRMITVKLKK